MSKIINKNFIFGYERGKFKSLLGLPLFSLILLVFLINLSSASVGEGYDVNNGNIIIKNYNQSVNLSVFYPITNLTNNITNNITQPANLTNVAFTNETNIFLENQNFSANINLAGRLNFLLNDVVKMYTNVTTALVRFIVAGTGRTLLAFNFLSGRIGINTENPNYLVDVNGTLRATDYKSADGTSGLSDSVNNYICSLPTNCSGDYCQDAGNNCGSYGTAEACAEDSLCTVTDTSYCDDPLCSDEESCINTCSSNWNPAFSCDPNYDCNYENEVDCNNGANCDWISLAQYLDKVSCEENSGIWYGTCEKWENMITKNGLVTTIS